MARLLTEKQRGGNTDLPESVLRNKARQSQDNPLPGFVCLDLLHDHG